MPHCNPLDPCSYPIGEYPEAAAKLYTAHCAFQIVAQEARQKHADRLAERMRVNGRTSHTG